MVISRSFTFNSIQLHSVAWSVDTFSLTTSRLMIASRMCRLHQATLLYHWMFHNCAWPVSSHECRWINWNWIQKNWIPPNWERTTNVCLCVLLWFLVLNPTQQNLIGFLEQILIKVSPFTHIYLLSAVHDSYHIRHVCLICCYLDLWIVQNYLQMLRYLATSITASLLCLVLQTLTSQNFYVFRIDWPMLWWSPHHLLAAFHWCLHWLPVKFWIKFKMYLLTYKIFVKHNLFIFTPWLSYHLHPVYWDQMIR